MNYLSEKPSIKDTLLLLLLILIVLITMLWIDSQNIQKHTIICDNHEVTNMCVILNANGYDEGEVSINDAVKYKLFNNPKNIEEFIKNNKN